MYLSTKSWTNVLQQLEALASASRRLEEYAARLRMQIVSLEATAITTEQSSFRQESNDEEDTHVDSSFDWLALFVAHASCPTCETLDDFLEIAKSRELQSYLRIEQLEEYVAQLQRQHEES